MERKAELAMESSDRMEQRNRMKELTDGIDWVELSEDRAVESAVGGVKTGTDSGINDGSE